MSQTLLVATAGAFVTFIVIDALWLSTLGGALMRPRLAYHLRERPLLGVALAFYVLYVVALVFFAVRPALASGSGQEAALTGAFFGLVTYGCYDLTNLATLKHYPPSAAAIDMTWGTLLSAACAYAGYQAAVMWGG